MKQKKKVYFHAVWLNDMLQHQGSFEANSVTDQLLDVHTKFVAAFHSQRMALDDRKQVAHSARKTGSFEVPQKVPTSTQQPKSDQNDDLSAAARLEQPHNLLQNENDSESDDDDDAPTVWQQKRNQRAQRQAKRI